jgi:serine/threonine protein kinase
MALITTSNSKQLVKIPNHETIISDILTFDNKELLLVSLLEKLCQIADNKNKLFKKICRYLNKIGVLEDVISYSDDKKQIRKLYIDYLSQVIQQVNTNKKRNLITMDNTQIKNSLAITNSQYSNAFLELEKIGNGGFGEVFKTYNYIDAQMYAIKKVPFFDIEDPNNMRAFNEVRCLSKLHHENVIRYNSTWLELNDKRMDIMEDNDIPIYPVLYIQMELCNESLKDYLMRRNYSGQEINFDFEKKCIHGIINGLKYIHNNDIVHRDLNPNNIFLDKNMQPKIGDFGLATQIEQTGNSTTMSDGLGVMIYMPPEYQQNNIYNKKSDVFSCGIILFELLYIFRTDMERYEIISEIKKNIYPSSFIHQFPEYHKLISKTLEPDLDERIDINDISL